MTGIAKHRKSGRVPKSPRFKHAMKRRAEAREIKAPPTTCIYDTVEEIFK